MLVIRSKRVILPEGERAASLHIDKGVIERVAPYGADDPTGSIVFNVPDQIVSPGLVDTHVHVNEPGRAEWEGFDTATRAAAAGGVTTIVDMPLNSIPATTTVAALRAKRESARAQCHVDVGFWGGVVPGNEGELDGLIDAGVRGFKCFLVPSGVDEFPAVDEAVLRRALPILARRKVPLLVHAELGIADRGMRNADSGTLSNPHSALLNPQSYATYLGTRPPAAEVEAIRLMIRLAGEFRVSTHIVHVSSAEGVDAIARAKSGWVPITAETCPHYLTFSAERIPDGATEFKCAPPIREASHREALWEGLDDGTIDMVVTDHSPAPPALKTPGNFTTAWGGIASLELALPAVWTAARARFLVQSSQPGETDAEVKGVSRPRVSDLSRWMSERPAALAGLSERKGRIVPGLDADLVVWDADIATTVDPARLKQRHKMTPYAGRMLFGRVITTFVRGERVWDKKKLVRAYGGSLL
ncbi:MAG: allantoinase AllB [Acidobacteria bacterium]|nr:allantoinase AllB [Acidobacteriota bacterium]